ncbi:tRNA (guanine(10)-N2)-methyltransferase homolog isoform X2 [Paramacrobiotus metropolitanus]|uniref:tRNA (guanine(10)-N2)-methyltransferase homolog isoform X2 n=1 Tax=Paramacrobiotus metropolitanus TaxID=2943436 RepID=UPI0024465D1F|nr:tRNA (guanine(10)-N2)-methyltransferase homolog isoform X2 [Paramacrobiotus metropolitanus]
MFQLSRIIAALVVPSTIPFSRRIAPRLTRPMMTTIHAGHKRYLINFAQEHIPFRLPELRSLCKLLAIPLQESELVNNEGPFLILTLENDEQARLLTQRSVLIRSTFECWIQAKSFANLLETIPHLPAPFTAPYSLPDSSFRIRIHSYGKKLAWAKITERVEDLSVLPFQGKVDLVNPVNSFHVLEDYGGDNVPYREFPEQVFFGRWIAGGGREAVERFRLDKRYFIGTTSMDPLLAMVMANQALVKEGSLVYDPFIGTGSLLIAAAHFGGYTMGSDIDRTLLYGRGKSTRAKNTWRNRDESVLSNFKQYQLESHYIDVLVSDATKNVLREDIKFDAVIADPPYGVREATTRTKKSRGSPECLGSNGYERVQLGKCDLNDLIVVLVDFAAKHLRIGGRLVYWLPAVKDEYNESAVPRHDCLELVSNSEQPLAGMTSRRLITMEKIEAWNADQKVTFAKDIYTNTFRERYFTATRNINGRQRHSADRDVSSIGQPIEGGDVSICRKRDCLLQNRIPLMGPCAKHCRVTS